MNPLVTTQNLSLYQAIEEFGRNLGAGIYAILVEVVICGERKLSIGFDLRMNYSPIPTERDLGSYCSFNRIYRGRDKRNNNKIQSWLKRSSLKSSNLVLHYAIQLHDLCLRQISLQAHPDALGRECAHHCKEQAGSISGIQPINFFHAELASKENPILRDLFDEIPDYVHGRTLTKVVRSLPYCP
jgi:hypothetical protein